VQWFAQLCSLVQTGSSTSQEEMNDASFLLTVKFLHELQHRATRLFLNNRNHLDVVKVCDTEAAGENEFCHDLIQKLKPTTNLLYWQALLQSSLI
jgi:hypothetical protein